MSSDDENNDPMVSGGSSNSEPAPLDVFVRKCFQMDYEVYEFIIPAVVQKLGREEPPSSVLRDVLEGIRQNWGGTWRGEIGHDMGNDIPVQGLSFLDFNVEDTRVTIVKTGHASA